MKRHFMEIAEGAKKNCPVSKALRALEITLKAKTGVKIHGHGSTALCKCHCEPLY